MYKPIFSKTALFSVKQKLLSEERQNKSLSAYNQLTLSNVNSEEFKIKTRWLQDTYPS